jgi:Protein of unknown function (DUF2849)
MTLKVVTANRLRDGAIVYRTAGGAWTEQFSEAAVADGEAGETRLLTEAAADVAARRVVAPYAFEIALSPAGPRALTQRERIRAHGPSVHPGLARTAHPSESASARRAE